VAAMWSPQPINGSYKIVFVENGNLAIINEDGTGKLPLTNNNANYFPMWSPTGNRIAFIKVTQPGSYGDLFMFDLTSNQQGPFTVSGDLPVWTLIYNPPMWAPNSTDTDYRITFLRDLNRNGNFDIYLLSSSNGQLTPLTNTGDVISYAVWSKDGDKIAYVRNINGNWDIFVMDMNTQQEYQITNDPAAEGSPMWSLIDNNKLLFIRNNGDQDNPNGDIYIVDINNLQIQPIVITPQDEEFVVWRPDGNKIAFTRDNGNNDTDIIVRDLNTGNETNLTQNLNGIADFPMWSPVPRP
jgi:Tol biopolymer transport system component